jgi:hypothetical protein
MPPTKAKVRAYDQEYEGIVLADKRKRALIQYRISAKGKLHSTMFTKCPSLAHFVAQAKNGTCFIEGSEATVPRAPKLKSEPGALALPGAPPPALYPAESTRAQRLDLLTQADAISKEIRACLSCRILREKRNILMEQADGLLFSTAIEADSEHGVRKVKKIITKPGVEIVEAE